MAAASKRNAILRVACKLVREQGASKLTLDAVAREAGISKGGLLYHFPSKEALIQATLDDFLDRFENQTEARAAAGCGSHPWTRAYLTQSFQTSPDDLETSAAVLAAASGNPALLSPMRERYEAWQSRIVSESRSPALATIARLAADGLFFCELFHLAPLEPRLRSEVLDALLGLADAPSPSPPSARLEVPTEYP
ncbi:MULTISPECIES: TetR/AcrR family transcriptional regulator [unclassified Paenibacillus]|uniref:TetR/AcrR family transcriptional regulator n=1 Tax=unclassified Paenibacillus TaxID=185978 RepID=UPI000955F9C1|nr:MULTISPECIES: TetR/AcrR family transcriptional regulator [unclassified Paenibacillus]ASS67955.2 TetR/AcrR family transcriptional regulator [Paenibacillus sp. RUD330]SIR42884.1 transcriptional regulator, TetR family [Paenibacillus sp. RU4X]SIR52967.1 transcriptional regulator, TetR family [Paenibacillus sp. RU4T]